MMQWRILKSISLQQVHTDRHTRRPRYLCSSGTQTDHTTCVAIGHLCCYIHHAQMVQWIVDGILESITPQQVHTDRQTCRPHYMCSSRPPLCCYVHHAHMVQWRILKSITLQQVHTDRHTRRPRYLCSSRTQTDHTTCVAIGHLFGISTTHTWCCGES